MKGLNFFSVEERMAKHNALASLMPLGFGLSAITARFVAASNVVTTVDQYRQSYQYSASVDGLLKNVYLPALNNTTFHATPLMEMFGDWGGKMDFTGNKAIKAFKHQGAGGFGGISEGGNFVKGRNQKGFQGFTRIKYLNAFFSLTGPAARTVRAGQGGYVDAVSSALDDTLLLAKQQMERIIGGDGWGELCRFTAGAIDEAAMANGEYVPTGAGATGTTEVILTANGGGAYTFVQWLQPGMRVHLVNTSNWDGALTSAHLVGPFEVGNVDYKANGFSLKYVGSASLDLATAIASAVTYLVLENAYGQTETAGGDSDTVYNCLEMNGLYNLVSDGTSVGETTANKTSIWGLTRSTYPHALKSTVELAAGEELDEVYLIGLILDLVNIKQSIPNVLVTDPKSRLKYFGNRKEDRRFDMKVMDSMFGFRSIGVVIDQYNLLLQSLSSLVPGTMFLLNTNGFKFVKATNGFEWIEDGGRILRNKEGSDNMFGTAINYCEFVCEDPKGQLKVTGLSYS